MLNPKQRYLLWEDYRKRVSALFGDVECDLHDQFAPYMQAEVDQDTETVRHLFDMVADLSAFVDRHTNELHEEYTAWQDGEASAQKAFEAWECGLCPCALSGVTNAPEPNGKTAYENIAALLERDTVNFGDTKHATAIWSSASRLLANE